MRNFHRAAPEIETAEEDLAAICRRYLLDAFPALRLIDPEEINRVVVNPDRIEMGELISGLLRSPQALLPLSDDEMKGADPAT